MMRLLPIPRSLTMLPVGLLLLALGLIGCSDSDSSQPQNDESLSHIEGVVVDERSGEPISHASVRTDPPSEEVITDLDGQFLIRLDGGFIDPVRVVVSHFAYNDRQTEITPLPGEGVQVSFTLQSSAIGLHASTSSLFFAPGVVRQSLRLSSNVQQTGFSIITTDPWVSVLPSSGVITNRETAVLQIMVDPERLPALPAQSELVINSDNGTRELVITLIIQGKITDSDAQVLVHDRQNDCRQNDVLRFGFDDPNGAIVQFPVSARLPSGAGPRGFDTRGNPFLIDSFIVEDLGQLTLEHRSGGPEDTSLEIFDLDKQDAIRTLATNTGVSETNRRAAITDWALVPGVYCYYLGGTNENFSQSYAIELYLGFKTAQ